MKFEAEKFTSKALFFKNGRMRSSTYVLISLLTYAVICFVSVGFAENFGDPLEKSWLILTPEADLGWRLRSNLDTRFFGEHLSTDENGNRSSLKSSNPVTSETIAIFGPSSAFGWGIANEKTYASLLGARNFSQIGYSVYQGLKQFSTIQNQLPDTVTTAVIAYGINEFDYFRFFDSEPKSDIEFFSAKAQGVRRVDMHWVLLPIQLISKRIYRYGLTTGLACPPILERQRMTEAEYFKTLASLVGEMKLQGITPVLLETAYRRKPRNEDSLSEHQELILRMKSEVNRKDCASASTSFSKWLSKQPEFLGLKVESFNQALSKFSKDNDDIPLVKMNHLLNEDDFIDPVHFSITGHSKIASALAQTLRTHSLNK